MYTIEDLKQGKCAILNDGTVGELNKILSLIKWPFQAFGSEKYYWIDLTGANCGCFIPDLPIQSVKDFIKQLNIKMGDKATKIESLYKVGDIVTIKDKYDYNFSNHDYPFSFTEYMKDHYGGKKCRISRVIYNSNHEDKPTYTEPFEYKLAELGENSYSWSAAMFKETPSSLFKCNKNKKDEELKESPEEFTFSEDDIPENFPCNPYVLDLGIQERMLYEKESAKEAFTFCINNNIMSWFTWGLSTQGFSYWRQIEKNPSFIPEDYVPKHFRSKFSNKDSYKEDFTIPILYKEVELVINKPICKF